MEVPPNHAYFFGRFFHSKPSSYCGATIVQNQDPDTRYLNLKIAGTSRWMFIPNICMYKYIYIHINIYYILFPMGPRNRGESIHTYVLLVYILFVFGTYSCNYSFQPIPTSLCFWVFRNPTPKPGPILSSRQIHTCCSPLPNFRRARCETSIASLPLRQLAVIQKQSDQQNPVFATATWKKNHPQCHMPYSNRRA